MSSASNASHAVDQVKEAVSTVHASLVDFGVQAMKSLHAARSQRVRALDSVLGQIGLQRRASAFRPVLFFVAGALVAGSVALVLAPTSGKKVRTKIVDLLGAAKDAARAGSRALTSVEHSAEAAVGGSNISGDGANRLI
jgi:hypothetical protein